MRINTQARLTALRQAFFGLTVFAAIGAILAGGLHAPQDPDPPESRFR